jgi:hypothetical protein
MFGIYRGRRLVLYILLAIILPRWWDIAPILL